MLQYILEATLCWTIFYVIFFGLLRKLTFFRVNRYYLLSSLVAGLLIPLLRHVNLNFYQEEISETIPLALVVKDMPAQIAFTVQEATITWEVYIHYTLSILYLSGLLFFAVRFIKALIKINDLKKHSRQERLGETIILHTNQEHLPFSFLQYVFISEKIALNEDFNNVLQHEIEHVKHWHTIDVLLVELIQISFWFNPMIYLYKTAIRQTHEYLADHAVLQNTNRKTYGTMLLKQSLSGLEIALTHRFFHSHIKKRINMMYQKKSGRSAWLKYALALPVLFVLAIVFANNETLNGHLLEDPKTSSNEENSTDFLKGLSQRLLRDKLINNPSQYTLTLSKGILTVNGDKQSNRLRDLYQSYFSELNNSSDRFSGGDIAAVVISPVYQSIRLRFDDNENTYNNEGPLPDHMLETMISQSQHQKYYFNNGKVLERLGSELLEDGLIKDDKKYNFLINDGQLIVNRQVSGSLQSKYEDLIRDLAQYPLEDDFELKIHVSGNESDFILGRVQVDVNEHIDALGHWEKSMIEEKKSSHKDTSRVEEIYKVVEEMPRFPGCEDIDGDHDKKKSCADEALIKYLYDHLKYPKEAIENKIEGRVFLQFVIDTDGTIDNTRIVRDIGTGCGKAALAVVEGMNNMSERWIPGRQQGKAVKVLYTLPVTFKLDEEAKKQDQGHGSIKPLIMINGIEFQGDLKQYVSSDDIATIDIIKNEAALKKYGNKGKNGIVEVTLKEGRSLSSAPMDTIVIYDPETFTETTVIKPLKDSQYKAVGANQSALDTLVIFDPETFEETTIITQDKQIGWAPEIKDFLSNQTKTKPLIIVDGQEYTGDIDKDINLDDIKKIEVVKGQKALAQYGEEGENGVVVIEMKKRSVDFGESIDQLQLPIDESINPLYIINGKAVSKAKVEKYSPDDIATINVVKGAAAKNKYGDKGVNGVVEITLKKKE